MDMVVGQFDHRLVFLKPGIESSATTVPGMIVLGFSAVLAVSELRSAILADFAMRGSAISRSNAGRYRVH
jgi:hypothetical protein